jgi:hypothetical protein
MAFTSLLFLKLALKLQNPTSQFEKRGISLGMHHTFPLLGLQKMIFDKFKPKQIVFVKNFQRTKRLSGEQKT